jgi:3-oxoacyl-[acyl-carrier-protein] synthase-3
LVEHLLTRLAQVQRDIGTEPAEAAGAATPFAELLDSMALVEFLAILAEDCGVEPEAIEEAARRRFTTFADLAEAMLRAGIGLRVGQSVAPAARSQRHPPSGSGTGACWLAATAVRLPDAVQPAEWINQAIGRPRGWLERHAGIWSRRVWQDQDPLAAAAAVGSDCVRQVGLWPADVGALLVTSEAPPLLVGMAAALHHRLGLPSGATVLEIGGACTGFLAALWTAQALVPRVGPVLVLAVEAPSQLLALEPGPAGENAALFGDGAAAAVLCDGPVVSSSVCLADVTVGALGEAGHCLHVRRTQGSVTLHMDGHALAGRAMRTMAWAVRDLASRHRLAVSDLDGVVAHAGNGRMAALLARQLGLPPDRVWSATATTGNLGSASLPVGWQTQASHSGPVAWAAVGAGLTWGVALTTG